MDIIPSSGVYAAMLMFGAFSVAVHAYELYGMPLENRAAPHGSALLEGLPLTTLVGTRAFNRGFLCYLAIDLFLFVLLCFSSAILELSLSVMTIQDTIGALDADGTPINSLTPILASTIVITGSRTKPSSQIEQAVRRLAHRVAGLPDGLYETADRIRKFDFAFPDFVRGELSPSLRGAQSLADVVAAEARGVIGEGDARGLAESVRRLYTLRAWTVGPDGDGVWDELSRRELRDTLTIAGSEFRLLDERLEPIRDPGTRAGGTSVTGPFREARRGSSDAVRTRAAMTSVDPIASAPDRASSSGAPGDGVAARSDQETASLRLHGDAGSAAFTGLTGEPLAGSVAASAAGLAAGLAAESDVASAVEPDVRPSGASTRGHAPADARAWRTLATDVERLRDDFSILFTLLLTNQSQVRVPEGASPLRSLLTHVQRREQARETDALFGAVLGGLFIGLLLTAACYATERVIADLVPERVAFVTPGDVLGALSDGLRRAFGNVVPQGIVFAVSAATALGIRAANASALQWTPWHPGTERLPIRQYGSVALMSTLIAFLFYTLYVFAQLVVVPSLPIAGTWLSPSLLRDFADLFPSLATLPLIGLVCAVAVCVVADADPKAAAGRRQRVHVRRASLFALLAGIVGVVGYLIAAAVEPRAALEALLVPVLTLWPCLYLFSLLFSRRPSRREPGIER